MRLGDNILILGSNKLLVKVLPPLRTFYLYGDFRPLPISDFSFFPNDCTKQPPKFNNCDSLNCGNGQHFGSTFWTCKSDQSPLLLVFDKNCPDILIHPNLSIFNIIFVLPQVNYIHLGNYNRSSKLVKWLQMRNYKIY